MKKRQAKRLLKCPDCGIGGFINLKAHVCKKKKAAKAATLEIIAPNESLKQIETHLGAIALRIRKKAEDLLYDLVEAGLYLLKAQAAHRVSNVGHAVDGKFDSSAVDDGFKGWLEDKYPEISRASAYNYINGAINCGLKVTDGPDAVEALRKSHALAGKTAGELYKLKDKNGADEEEEVNGGGTKWSLVRDAAVNYRDSSDTVIELKPHMSKKAYSTVCARALRTLEELTGSTWDMVTRRKNNHFREHGDVYELGT